MRLVTVTLTTLLAHSFSCSRGGLVSANTRQADNDNNNNDDGGSGGSIIPIPSPIQRDSFTRQNCMDINGIIVEDNNEDGAIYQDSYFCQSNDSPPVGNIVLETDVNGTSITIPVEGICCGPALIPISTTERWNYTRDECTAMDGIIIGDAGDGAIFQNTYFCANNGFPPVANIIFQDVNSTTTNNNSTMMTTVAVDGEVCCGPNTTGLVTVDDFAWPPMSSDECIASNGVVTSDPGDGSTFQSGYVCVDSDLPPIGTVILEDISLADEGQVCCPNWTMDGGDGDNTDNTTVPDRAVYTREECLDANGSIVGDIGDGSIFNDDFICDSNGFPPLGNVIPNNSSEPVAIEGEVCCGGTLTEVDLGGSGTATDPVEERDFYTRQECLAVNGTIVGDIGNGAIFELDYVCNSTGLPPVADIVQGGTFFALEGEVCCADPAATRVDQRELSRTECADQGGEVIGDIGNGVTQDPGYVCASNGEAPLGNVIASDGEPLASEGEVCCGVKDASAGVSSNVTSAGVSSLAVSMTAFWISSVLSVALYSWLF